MITLPNRFTCMTAIAACVLLTPLTGCNKVIDPTSTAKPTTIGVEIDDSVVTARVKSALLADDYVKGMEVKVATRKGEVMLSGFADAQSQIDRSILVTKEVEGVKSVINQLSLKEGKQSIGNKIDDSVITAGVKAALLQDPMMKSMEISVKTRIGEVQLSGFVDSTIQSNHAVEVAKSIEGVNAVVNNMSIKK
jgi:hyperosmotically inducible protein